MKEGNAHSPYNPPIVPAGRGGGNLASGRHLVHEKKTPLCDLYRSILVRMDTPLDHFGDSTGELPGLADAGFGGVTS